jgi:hypothetical protein
VKQVSDYLGSTLDPFLLADIYGALPSGESYAHAIDKDYKGSHSDWLFDETKATIIYAQMHKSALENPNEEIIFDFYDDRGFGMRAPKDILEELHEFFSKNPELIPPNVTLRLNHYAGDKVRSMEPIKGKKDNIIDANYRKTVLDMAEVTKKNDTNYDGIMTPIYVARNVTAKDLNNRLALMLPIKSVAPLVSVKEGVDEVDEELSLKGIDFTPAMVRFYQQLEVIQKKATELRSEGHTQAADKADAFHEKLYKGSILYFNNRIDDKAFSDICRDAFKEARPELEKHRGWKQILGNLALAIAGLGIGYVFAGLINKAVTGHFLFFRTDSAMKLDAMEEAAHEVVPVVA